MSIKGLIAAVACVAVTCDTRAAVQSLPFTDHFTYSEGSLASVASGVWDVSQNGAEMSVSNAAALSSPSGFAEASGKGVKWSPSGTARRNLVQFSSATTGAVYASFLLNVQSNSGTRLIAYFENSTAQQSSPQLGIFVSSGSIGVGKKASTPAVTASAGSGTHSVVVRYSFQGGDDQADLWVDPSSSDYGAAVAPASLGSTTGASDPSAIQYFAISAASGTGPALFIDEVRIGTSWADVTPSSGGPPLPPAVTNLVVTQTFLTPDGLVLRGTGGSPTGTYEVVTSSYCLGLQEIGPLSPRHRRILLRFSLLMA